MRISTGYIIFATLSVKFKELGGSSNLDPGLALEKLKWVDPILCSTGDRDDDHQGYEDDIRPVVNHGGDDDVDDDLLLR